MNVKILRCKYYGVNRAIQEEEIHNVIAIKEKDGTLLLVRDKGENILLDLTEMYIVNNITLWDMRFP